MGRKAQLRQRRDRRVLLNKRQKVSTAITSDRWEDPLIFPKYGYTFLAEWILGDCEMAQDLRNIAKERVPNAEKSILVMPFEILGKGNGVAFIQSSMRDIDSFFGPANESDRNLQAFFNSQQFSDTIAEIAGKLLTTNRLITDRQMFLSIPIG